MRRIVAVVAAGIMVAGTAALAAPAASAYPAGSDPKVGVAGGAAFSPGGRLAVSGFNFTPGCSVALAIASAAGNMSVNVTGTVGPKGYVLLVSSAPKKTGVYSISIQQTKVLGTCAGFHPSTGIRVRAVRDAT
jgi:hypothetical protein